MTSYTEYDLERDLHDARRARERARSGRERHNGERHSSDRTGGLGAFLRSRTTDHWIMFVAGFAIGALLF